MIPFKNRFHGYNSLSYIYKNGKTFRSKYITLKIVENKYRQESRLSVVVSKKIYKSAVKRNKIRRKIYECLRLKWNQLDKIYDLVIIVNLGDVIGISSKELNSEIDNLLKQAKALKD